MSKNYFPTLQNQQAVIQWLQNNLPEGRANRIDYLDTNIGSRAPANTALTNGVWTNGRAANLDKLQAILNTPNGDTLAAWISAINAQATAANQNAANAYNKANEALLAAQNAANVTINNSVYQALDADTEVLLNSEKRENIRSTYSQPSYGLQLIARFMPKQDGMVVMKATLKINSPVNGDICGLMCNGLYAGSAAYNEINLVTGITGYTSPILPFGTTFIVNQTNINTYVSLCSTTSSEYVNMKVIKRVAAGFPVNIFLHGSSHVQTQNPEGVACCKYISVGYTR